MKAIVYKKLFFQGQTVFKNRHPTVTFWESSKGRVVKTFRQVAPREIDVVPWQCTRLHSSCCSAVFDIQNMPVVPDSISLYFAFFYYFLILKMRFQLYKEKDLTPLRWSRRNRSNIMLNDFQNLCRSWEKRGDRFIQVQRYEFEDNNGDCDFINLTNHFFKFAISTWNLWFWL